MKTKLVVESLDEMLESKKVKESNDSPAQKVKQSKYGKAKQAIEALEKQLAAAKKPGAFATTREKDIKIAEIEKKIKAWKKDLH
jgi:hypothetical protein